MVASLAERRSAALSVLDGLGYHANQYVEGYPVWLGGDASFDAAIVAFATSAPQDMSTATVVFEINQSFQAGGRRQQAAVEAARALAAPVLVEMGDASARLLAVQSVGEPRLIQDVPYAELDSVRAHRERLGPIALLESKVGRGQLSLLPLDVSLLTSARSRTEEYLTPRVERALEAAVEITAGTLLEVRGSPAAERHHQQAARLVVGALTALVLRDKEGLEDLSPGGLVDVSQQRFAEYFNWMQSANSLELSAFQSLVSVLGEGVNYRGLDPRLLSKIYETTLVSDLQRRQLGTHYTPPELARRMMETLPIEYLRPEDRVVMDPTCGSGGLLLAAHDRLRNLQPQSWPLTTSHADLTAHLRGFDADAFAVELARLSLLLHALPAGNGWQVEQADVLSQRLAPSERPNVIVANPPWGNTNMHESHRRETADAFLRWMIRSLRPGGFLSVVLPVGWLNSRASSEVRDELSRSCDLFEVWRLPEATFESARMAPAVIFAQKKEQRSDLSGGRLLKRVVRGASLSSFYMTGKGEETLLLPPNEGQPMPMLAGPITSALLGRPDTSVLADAARIVTGPQPEAGLTGRDRTDPAIVPFLRNAKSVAAFDDVSSGEIIGVAFPEDLQSGSRRGEEGLRKRKVVVSAARSAENPWRLKPLLDQEGVLVRNSLQMVIPHDFADDDSLYGLLAVLGSAFAATWIDESVSGRNISTRHLSQLPIPDDIRDPTLVRLGQELHAGNDRTATGRDLDSLMWQLMGVPEAVAHQAEARLAGFNAPEGVPRYSAEEAGGAPSATRGIRRRRRWGVARQDADGAVVLDIPGVTTGEQSVSVVPPAMPGWMLRPGATFGVFIDPEGSLDDALFAYQAKSWMTEEELESATRPPMGKRADG